MKVIGHRGASAIAPENTWESFDLALQLGADAIETDIQATSDGELILIHDPDLTRTTNGRGLVAMTSWSQISQLDAGSWFDRAYYGAKVPRLRETLERYSHKTHFVLEIKQKGIEAEVVKMVQELNLIEAVTLTCFEVEVVQNIKQLCPEINLEWLMIETDEKKISQARQIGVNHVCLSAPLISPEIVSRWHAIDLPVRAWNVTDSDVMISALQSGVEAMTVDHLHLLINILKHY
jgi:glycerophosphoryl diester phosphodiesterase